MSVLTALQRTGALASRASPRWFSCTLLRIQERLADKKLYEIVPVVAVLWFSRRWSVVIVLWRHPAVGFTPSVRAWLRGLRTHARYNALINASSFLSGTAAAALTRTNH